MTTYYINESTSQIVVDVDGNVGAFVRQAPWRLATQEEIDAYLLEQAKSTKVDELKADRKIFEEDGYEYSGDIVCDAWASETTYATHDLVLATDTKNYQSIQDDNLDHEPPNASWWEEFKPVFRTNECSIVNLVTVSDNEFYCNAESDGFRHKIDFGDAAGWTAFINAMNAEKDRIMKKYNDYRTEIAACVTVAAVEAITITFAA